MKAKKLIVDTKTGEERIVEFNFTPTPLQPEGASIDFKKLIDVLINKGIITDKEELK